MTTFNWVEVSSFWFGRGQVADMGPYIGPWPLLPPAVGIFREEYPEEPEIDFVVALPNTAHPGDPNFAVDYTYDTPVWDSYRYISGGGDMQFGYYGDWAGPGGRQPVPPNPPKGVHLWVVYYGGGSPPFPPEHYVPASYVKGGKGAFQTAMGHWVENQPPWELAGIQSFRDFFNYPQGGWPTVSANKTFLDSKVYADAFSFDLPYDPSLWTPYDVDHDIGVVAEDLLNQVVTDTTSNNGFSFPTYIFDVSKSNDGIPLIFFGFFTGFGGHADTSGELEMTLEADVYTVAGSVTDFRWSPTVSNLTYNVEISQPPYIDSTGNPGREVEYSSQPTATWDPVQNVIYGYYGLSGLDVGAYPEYAMYYRMGWSATLPAPSWNPPMDGYIDFVIPDSDAFTTGDPVPVTGYQGTSIVLYYGPRLAFTHTLDGEGRDFAMPPNDTDHATNEINRRAYWALSRNPTATGHWPTYRYWRPGPIIPAEVPRDVGNGVPKPRAIDFW